MPLKMRLSRGGSKKRPYYRIVIADARAPRDGRYIERVGRYNPLLPKDHEERVVIDAAKADAWIKKGATPTDRVARFLSQIHVKEVDAAEFAAHQAALAKADSQSEEGAEAAAAPLESFEGLRLIRVPEGESGARPLYTWAHGNNPKKGEPGEKAKLRVAEKAEKEEARRQAEEEAKAAAAAEAEAAKAEPADSSDAQPEGEAADA